MQRQIHSSQVVWDLEPQAASPASPRPQKSRYDEQKPWKRKRSKGFFEFLSEALELGVE